MRLLLAPVLLMALCVSAEARAVHHQPRHHQSVRGAYGMAPRFVVPPGPGFDQRFPPVIHDQTPSYDDPSKFGGG